MPVHIINRGHLSIFIYSFEDSNIKNTINLKPEITLNEDDNSIRASFFGSLNLVNYPRLSHLLLELLIRLKL